MSSFLKNKFADGSNPLIRHLSLSCFCSNYTLAPTIFCS